MFRTGWLAGLFLLAGASLTACNPEAAGGVDSNSPFDSRAERAEDKFGEGFGKAFRADPNSEPRDVSDDDVVPVSYTTEPVLIE